jgi:protease secretion system membrane fusion protein
MSEAIVAPMPDVRRLLRLGWLVMLFGFGGFLAWAFLAPLDGGVAVQGALVAEGNRKPVQHTSGGRVAEVLVREGDAVREGQVLVRLDTTQTRAIVNAARESLAGLRSQVLATRAARATRVAQVQSLREQMAGVRPLAQEGYVPKNRLSELERQDQQLAGAIAQDDGTIAQAEKQMDEIRQKLVAQEYELAQAEIRANATGIVQSLAVFGPGVVISPGQVLMEIVPRDAALVVEAQVPVNLIDRVRPGLPVELNFTALNRNTTPVLNGEVLGISPDRIVDQRTGTPYYRMRTSVGDVGPAVALALRHGMPVDVFVKTGERSLMSYLVKPFVDRWHGGMRED